MRKKGMDAEQMQSPELTITRHMIDSMRSTRPWAMFVSILGFIIVGFMLLAAMVIMVLGSVLPQEVDGFPAVLIGIVYIIMSFFYLVPSIYLFKYSSAIGSFLYTMSESEMESALTYQQSFWKFVGIVGIIMIAFAILGIIAAIVIPFIIGIQGASG
jgi:hypothetical protein